MCKCMVRLNNRLRNIFNCLLIRARGGRDAEREERQLWETPERKVDTKRVNRN